MAPKATEATKNTLASGRVINPIRTIPAEKTRPTGWPVIMPTPPAPNGRTVVSFSTGPSEENLREGLAHTLKGSFIEIIIYLEEGHRIQRTLNHNGLLVFAEGTPKRVGDFAERGQGFHRGEDGGH